MVLLGNIRIGRYWFGVLPLHVGHLEHLLPGTSLGFEYLKQGKYISGDERGGLDSSFKGRKIGWRKDSLCRQGRIKEKKL
jgi:hypothetical protein